VVLCGNGKAFCAGGDLKWVQSYPEGISAAFHELAARFHAAILEIRRMPKPVIAAINGVAAGGGFSLALACDFRVMDPASMLRQAYTSNGLCIDGGGTFSLWQIVGLARAMEIAAFDEPIPAEKAFSWGLTTKISREGSALAEALEMASLLAEKSLQSFRWSKKLLIDASITGVETQMERERQGIRSCGVHPDGREGLLAFSERRPPRFPAPEKSSAADEH
jgi:2-(1,2-epoxy-1,2-dihydrophenyl)acetyl-CoA isomerase